MRTCSVTDCQNKATRRGWCNNHYERWRRNGHPTKSAKEVRLEAAQDAVQPTEKACKKCGEVKPLEDYFRRLTPSLWYYPKCKVCMSKERKAKRIEQELLNPRPPRPKKAPVDHGECSFDGCTHKAKARIKNGPEGWYCNVHWMQWYNRGYMDTIIPKRRSFINDDFRLCTACEQVKPQEDFHDRTGGGKQTNCKPCLYKVARTNYLLREGRLQEALDVAETMAVAHKEKYVARCLAAIKEAGIRKEQTNE